MVGGAPLAALLPALAAVGPGLAELRYTCYADQDTGQINFSTLAAACPNLRVLAISGNALVYDAPGRTAPYSGNALVYDAAGRTAHNSGNALVYDAAGRTAPYYGEQLLAQLRSVTINVHAYVPRYVWTRLMRECRELESLELTKCEGLNDESLLDLLQSEPACLRRLNRFCVRGTHRGDIKLTERSVAALRMRSEQLDHVGDCYTWDLRTVSCTADQIRGLL
jgi:hypothetical protein